MINFIPSLHFVPAEEKMKEEWAMKVVNNYLKNTNNYNLLWNKNVLEIEQYSSGEFDLTPFKRMFKSMKKSLAAAGNDPEKSRFLNANNSLGIDFTCLPLIPEKVNSAVAISQKIPLEVSAIATDPLAIEKRQEDINFIKNKPMIEAELQDVSDRLQLGAVDIGNTKHSSVEFGNSPFGLDLNEPDELDLFINLLYSLKIETAFETGLQAFYEIKNGLQVKALEIRDHFKFGVSCHDAFQNDLTGLPDVKYIFPGDVEVPYSDLPDFSDNTHRIVNERITALELLDAFSSEINGKEDLDSIINSDGIGYYACNNNGQRGKVTDFGSYKVNLKKIQVKTVDWVGVRAKSKKGYKSITLDEKEAAEKIWFQNTYEFYWLVNTKRIFGIKRLPFSERTKGQESFQNFTTNIFKSQERSAVELSIGENKKAQIAEIKLQHTIIMSLPPGRVLNLHGLRGAIDGLKDSTDEYTTQDLINLAFEHNKVIIDTEGFDGKNDGQFKPVEDLIGGLKMQEIGGYLSIIANANANISRITGINEQLTGSSANPEGLVGLQKLLINSSINSMYYATEAIREQYQKLFSCWANVIKQAIDDGGKPKEAIVNLIGSRKASVIDGLKDSSLHSIGIFIRVSQREEERQKFEIKLAQLTQAGAISAADEFLLQSIQNPKDKYALLAVKEIKFKREQSRIREENFANQQQLVSQQGENAVAKQAAVTDGEIKNTYAKGDVQSKILQLAAQLGINASQLDGLIKRALQNDRNKAQTDKNIATLEAKSDIEQTKSLI